MGYKYIYRGPVLEFDRIVADDWKASTYANSEAKARSNLAYQFKKQNNKIPASRITLPGKLECVDERRRS